MRSRSRSRVPRTGLVAALALGLLASLALLAGCGSSDGGPQSGAKDSAEKAAPDAVRELGDKDWLLRLNLTGGADAEAATAVYLKLRPATGETSLTRLPPVTAGETYGGALSLLVNADHTYALTDATVSRSDRRRGQLSVYALEGGTPSARQIDLRRATGKQGLEPIAASFDPADADLVRVVDTAHRVWSVSLSGRATKLESRLATRTGVVFNGGFDPNSGLPFVENVDTGITSPPHNGFEDTRPTERSGGLLLDLTGGPPKGMPDPDCAFGTGFKAADGSAWAFCIRGSQLDSEHLAAGGRKWAPVGPPVTGVVNGRTSELPFVLPPPA